MKHNFKHPRALEPKMGKAVAERTVLRTNESWRSLANRVARGNCALSARLEKKELSRLRNHIANASILMSGRHLQHGDIDQPKRNLDVFSNCSTASTSFLKYYLLLNGSGVGRCYDDDMMLVDWSLMPYIHCVISENHPDFNHTVHESLDQAKHKYGSSEIIHYEVGDSREGWAQLVEYLEWITFQGSNFDKIVLADFSKVRPRGAKIKGMQNRPSSGPVPLMNAINAICTLKGSLIPKWKQAMYVDHYLAECVLVGGARRSARIAVKGWRDPDILEFIGLKSKKFNGGVPLWSSNNSVSVDKTFWRDVKLEGSWAQKVYIAVVEAAYYDGTGEPGFVNVDRLEQSESGMSDLINKFHHEKALGTKKYKITNGYEILRRIATVVHTKQHKMIPNPCIPGYMTFKTKDERVRIDTITVGEEVWDGQRYVRVVKVWSTGFKDVYKYVLANGKEIDCTQDHKVVVDVDLNGFLVKEEAHKATQILCDGGELSDVLHKFFVGKFEVFDFTVDSLEHVASVNDCIISNCGEISLNMLGAYCVEGNTRILHREGYGKIKDLVGQEIEVFNGETWSKTTPFVTGINQDLLRIKFSDGSYLDCTYSHEFSVRKHRQSKTWRKVRARHLQAGDCLPKFQPKNISGQSLRYAYEYGLFLGDGAYYVSEDRERVGMMLYGEKQKLKTVGSRGTMDARNGGIRVSVAHLDKDKLISLKDSNGVPEWVFNLDEESLNQFISGLIDTDGTLHEQGGISITTIYKEKAQDLQLLLRRLGVSVSVNVHAEAGSFTNFGVRNNTLWRVHIQAGQAGLFKTQRCVSKYKIDLEKFKQQKVVSVEVLAGKHTTYCFSEPERHMGVFNNVLTYQCVIADVVPYYTESQQEFEEAARLAARALMRVNLMPCVYEEEVRRTNRIGVGLTGIHEYAWARFGFGFRDLLDEQKSLAFWYSLSGARDAVLNETRKYAAELGTVVPHSCLTIKPAGTTSKLFGLSEGAHLPSMKEYVRWVQFRSDSHQVEKYRKLGYKIKTVKSYSGTVIIGFPTQPVICKLGMKDKLLTASEATPEEQFKWVQLLEKYWLGNVRSNQVSYTLKYDKQKVSYKRFYNLILEQMPNVKCISVMPFMDKTSYEYQPEQAVTLEEYDAYSNSIKEENAGEIDVESLKCASGACPVEIKEKKND